MVIEQHTTTDNPLLAPSPNAVHVAARLTVGSVNIIERNAVVEDLFFLVAEVAQAVPLG